MAPSGTQYQHYIPRFILRQFAYTQVKKKSYIDGFLQVFDLPSEQFRLGEVSKTCGEQTLYYDKGNSDGMRIEHLFSKLESKTANIFNRIKTAVDEGSDHVDILEKDIHTLFKFMNLSCRRFKEYRDDIENPYRENDFMFQHLFEASKKRGGSGEPGQFWLEDLLYLLETSHEDLLLDAEKPDHASADTYRHFTQNYALQIWKAADGYEFFLNDRLVDFESETESYLGTEVKETGSQLICMTTDDMIHRVLPISPEIAVIFCDESRCWESPFAEMKHRLKIPYPKNSLLKSAPHKDIVNIDVPREKRGKKTCPATVAWRVSIGTLSRPHHRVINSYSLSHAQSFIVARSRAPFERARRELGVFTRERMEVWESRGMRVGPHDARPRRGDESAGLTEAQVKEIVDQYMSALDEIHQIFSTRREVQRPKEMALKCWMAVRALEHFPGLARSSKTVTMHPALKDAFEAAYPPKHPNHKDLITMEFGEFFAYAIGEETFVKLSSEIDKKIGDLVKAHTLPAHFEASQEKIKPLAGSSSREDDLEEVCTAQERENLANPAVESIVRAATDFGVLKWMFEERQDILATFVQKMAEPMESMRPSVIRIRGRRE